MANYNYRCTEDCLLKDLPDDKHDGLILMSTRGGELVWEVSHGMSEEPDIKCPLCGAEAIKTLLGVPFPEAYIRGNCYLDKEGCRRDMDLYKLNKGQDPYAHMRQPGELDDLKNRLRRGGKHNPKTKYFT
jgi:hypothetical protein